MAFVGHHGDSVLDGSAVSVDGRVDDDDGRDVGVGGKMLRRWEIDEESCLRVTGMLECSE